MKHLFFFPSVEVQLEVSGAFPGMGELGEGAPSLSQVGRVSQAWKTRRQRARDPCGGGREVSHLPGSALLLAGKRAFTAQVTRDEQENKMQIREERNFRRVSFLIYGLVQGGRL